MGRPGLGVIERIKQTHLNKRIIIAGGGTGGHIFPALAIAGALGRLENGIDLLFVGAKGKMEMQKVPEAGYRIEGIDIVGFNRSSLIKNLSLPLKLIKSFLQVKKITADFRPDAVVGVGGYSSFPVLRYAQAKGIPTFIHESNSFAGKSNILLGKKATKVFVASEGMQRFFDPGKIVLTGNPVRKTIAESRVSREEGLQHFGLQADYQTIFVVGGSLGARSINEAIEAALPRLAAEKLQLIWQTGRNNPGITAGATAGWDGVWKGEFIKDMQMAFAAADAVISRAGAMAIAELCVVAKPVIFVPYPFASEDHQTKNAQHLADHGAGLVVRDKELKEKLVPVLLDLLGNTAKKRQLQDQILKLGTTNADDLIAREILRSIA